MQPENINTLKISLTSRLPSPNIYVQMLPEFKDWIYLENQAQDMRGHWRSLFLNPQGPLDLEIGCGNGFFFENQVRQNPGRNLVGLEIKYKPLVQTVRRVKKEGLSNGKGLRFNARVIDQAFSPEELDNVYIYFPDPWPRRTQNKNRLMNQDFFEKLFKLQKFGSFVDIKTDSLDYFNFAENEIKKSPYKVVRLTRDLHHSEWRVGNFMTSFEKIFVGKEVPINYIRLEKVALEPLTNNLSRL